MNGLQNDIQKVIEKLPPNYLEEVLDFALFLSKKANIIKTSDTEYLTSIPGMVDSIQEASKTEIKDCSKELDW